MITDARVLQPEFIPSEVQHRDAEVNHLSSALDPITNGQSPDPVLLHGPSGAGKIYIIPLPRDRRIKRICKQFDQKKRGQPEREEDVPIHIDSEYHRYGPVKGKPGQTRVQTTLVVLPPGESRDRPQPFATNLEVKNLTAVDRRSTKQRIEEYSKRGGIEQSYSSIKKCAAWTTSKAFEVRWFHFAFATIVYNTWLLVDLLTQMRTAMVTTRSQPRITLDRFLQWLDQAFAGQFS